VGTDLNPSSRKVFRDSRTGGKPITRVVGTRPNCRAMYNLNWRIKREVRELKGIVQKKHDGKKTPEDPRGSECVERPLSSNLTGHGGERGERKENVILGTLLREKTTEDFPRKRFRKRTCRKVGESVRRRT